jgi:hypothetical protein
LRAESLGFGCLLSKLRGLLLGIVSGEKTPSDHGAADMEAANTFVRPPQPEPGLSNGLSLPKTDDIVMASFAHRS